MKLALASTRPDSLAQLRGRDLALFQRFPADFRAFYEEQNGGRPKRDWEFSAPIERSMRGETHTGVTQQLEELWAFMPYRVIPANSRPRSILREHFGRHVGENFLPRDVYVFGYALQSSLLAISLAPHNFGEVLYWEWYWRYPWFEGFFTARVHAAKRAFEHRRLDLYARQLSADHELGDALNYATLVPVAPSFEAFVKGLTRAEDD